MTFDLWVNACLATAIAYTCTKFGVDSSSRFPFRARTNRQTDKQTRLNAIPMPVGIEPARVTTNHSVAKILWLCLSSFGALRCKTGSLAVVSASLLFIGKIRSCLWASVYSLLSAFLTVAVDAKSMS